MIYRACLTAQHHLKPVEQPSKTQFGQFEAKKTVHDIGSEERFVLKVNHFTLQILKSPELSYQ